MTQVWAKILSASNMKTNVGMSNPSIGADIQMKEILIENQHVNLQNWDNSRQERFQSLVFV